MYAYNTSDIHFGSVGMLRKMIMNMKDGVAADLSDYYREFCKNSPTFEEGAQVDCAEVYTYMLANIHNSLREQLPNLYVCILIAKIGVLISLGAKYNAEQLNSFIFLSKSATEFKKIYE